MLSEARPRRVLAARSCGWYLLVICLTGCSGTRVFQANQLPAQLIAKRTASVHSIDHLASISRSIGNSEVLYPGDLIKVTVTTGIEESAPEPWSLRIAENGVCSIPIIGDIPVAGLGISQAEERIRVESIRRGKFVKPNVAVVLDTRRFHRVRVGGEVEKPDIYEIPAQESDLLGALMHAGGLSKDAGTIIEVQHPPPLPQAGHQLASFPGAPPPGPRVMRVDLERVSSGDGGGDFRLYDGSTVMVMKRPARYVHVIGLVNRPNQFEMPDDGELTLLGAISMAGGLRLEIADKVHVMRRVPDTDELVVIEASLRKAKSDGTSNIRLAPEDVVSVEETPTTFVVGTIRDFVRFGFTGGVPGL